MPILLYKKVDFHKPTFSILFHNNHLMCSFHYHTYII